MSTNIEEAIAIVGQHGWVKGVSITEDVPTPMSVVDEVGQILEHAADLIEERGWFNDPHDPRRGEGALCAAFAINRASTLLGNTLARRLWDERLQAMDRLKTHLGG